MGGPDGQSERQDALYAQATAAHGGMIARLTAGYEADPVGAQLDFANP